MNFCTHCGHKLTKLKTDSSWEAKYRCDGCEVRYLVTYGDHMGGSSDTTHEFSEPFDEEVAYE